MKLIYSTQRSDFKEGCSYRNPQYFERVENGVKSVEVVGDWPNVVAAYEAIGIEVDGVKADDYSRLTVAQIKDVLSEKEITIPDGVTKRDNLLALLKDQ